MSQEVGVQYKSRIPSFSDDASIVEALKVYHYGVDDWTTQPIPDDSIEGNFRTLHDDVSTIQAQLATLDYVQLVSSSATPNVIISASAQTTTIPLRIRAITSQTSPLFQWENSASVSVGSVSTGGFLNLAGYITIGSTTQSTTTGVNVIVSDPTHIGVAVRAQTSQTANIQEWQNSGGTAIAWVDQNGTMYSRGDEVATDPNQGIGSFFLMGG